MKKIVVLSLGILVACVAVSDVVSAQDNQRRRKLGFFERLFGGFDRPRVERRRAWWEDDNDPGYRIVRPSKPKSKVVAQKVKKKKSAPAPVAIDPEEGENLGMGNLDYVPPKTLALFDPGFAKLASADVGASAIRVVLADRSTGVRATEPVRKAVLEHYKATGFKPVWTDNGNINARGLALLDILSKSGAEGLEPLRYKPAVLKGFEGAVAQLDGDGLGLAQFDVGLTAAAVTYAQHISGGVFEPENTSAYYDVKNERISPDVAVRVLAYSPFPAEYLKSLAPTHPAYTLMKSELAKLASVAPSDQSLFPDGKRVRIGQKDPRVDILRERLIDENYIALADAQVAEGKRDVLDKVLGRALKRFQEAKGIAQTSNLDAATVKALNGPDSAELKDKLLSSMERVRWLPKNLGNRHVFVNQASYRVNLMENGRVVWASNVIVGKPLTQTAVFSDTFETVVFNPTWGVPQSIIINEYLPKLRANPGYLDKIGFKVTSASGKVVSSRSVDWNRVGRNSGIGIMQPAGGSNALGEVKFLFPNKHSIYMHDTPNRDLFAETKRNFSHGCVRVENPREFAEVLLGWDRDRVDGAIDGGESTTVKVKQKTNVHLAYFTAWPDEDGVMRYHSDAYGRDLTLKNARALMRKLNGANEGTAIVSNSQQGLLD
jgi:L,D-transpeptidase YcbB